MKKIFILVFAAIALLSSQAYAVHPKLKEHREPLNDAQKFEQQLLQRRNAARRAKTKKISGSVNNSGNFSVSKESNPNSVKSSSSSSSSKGKVLYSTSGNSSVATGMYAK